MSQHQGLPELLRKLRASRKLSQDRFAAAIGVSKSFVSHFESGKAIPQEGTAQRIDELFGTGTEIQEMAKTAFEDRKPWLRSWTDHERRAALLRAWEPLVIPGLLQTEEYARAIFAATPANALKVDDLIATRLKRQAAVLNRDPPVTLSTVVAEGALRIGPREIMKPQLAHLVDLGHRPTVQVRVLPADTGFHAGLAGPISMATLQDGRRVAYLDDQLKGRTASTMVEIEELELPLTAVEGAALSVLQSRDLILRVIDEYR